MTQQEYDQKKRECWEEFCRANPSHNKSIFARKVFDYAFDRAYALGKQEKDAKPNNTIKARRKSDGEIIEVREWRGASDVIYSLPDMNQFYQASDLDFNLDADTVIQGWVARDKNGLLSLFRLYRPERGYDYNGDYGEWGTKYCSKKINEQCKLYAIEKDRCPSDCPRLYAAPTRCELSDCTRIKKLIKRFKI